MVRIGVFTILAILCVAQARADAEPGFAFRPAIFPRNTHPTESELQTVCGGGCTEWKYVTLLGEEVPVRAARDPLLLLPLSEIQAVEITPLSEAIVVTDAVRARIKVSPRWSQSLQAFAKGPGIHFLLVSFDQTALAVEPTYELGGTSVPGGLFASVDKARAFYAKLGLVASVSMAAPQARDRSLDLRQLAWSLKCEPHLWERSALPKTVLDELRPMIESSSCDEGPPLPKPTDAELAARCGEQGETRAEGSMVDGVKDGPWIVRNDHGDFVRVEFYHRGHLDSTVWQVGCDPKERSAVR